MMRRGEIALAVGIHRDPDRADPAAADLAARYLRWLSRITFSVLILMTAVFIEKPLEFSSFPTILLIATMLRLALNLPRPA